MVTTSVQEKKVKHPVLWDEDCRNTETYGISAWPVAYLIGVDGRVIWEGNPQRVVSRSRPKKELLNLLEKELKKVKRLPSPTGAKDPGVAEEVATQPSQP